MSVLDWLNSSFLLFGLEVKWADFLGNIFALATVVLALRRLVIAWPVQVLGSVLLLIATLNAHLGGNAARQVVIIISALYGWATWRRKRAEEGQINVIWATPRQRLLLAAGMVLGTLAFGAVLKSLDASFYPGAPWILVLADAWIFVGSLLAMYSQARRFVEFWFIWLAVDLVGVPLAISSGLYVTAFVFGIFFVMVLIGIRSWSRQSKLTPATAEPAAID